MDSQGDATRRLGARSTHGPAGLPGEGWDPWRRGTEGPCARCQPRFATPHKRSKRRDVSQIVLQRRSVSVFCFETFKKQQFMVSGLHGLGDQRPCLRPPSRCLKFQRNAVVLGPENVPRRNPPDHSNMFLVSCPRPKETRLCSQAGIRNPRKAGIFRRAHWEYGHPWQPPWKTQPRHSPGL